MKGIEKKIHRCKVLGFLLVLSVLEGCVTKTNEINSQLGHLTEAPTNKEESAVELKF